MPVETPTIEEQPLIKYEEIAYLEASIREMLEQMLPNIERGEYDLIIGIDASGRIPTLIVKKFIEHVYSRNGFVMPNTKFVAGHINKDNAEERVEKWSPLKKVLIVEDTIAIGTSINNLCLALDYENIKFDIAAVSALLVGEDGEIDHRIIDSLGAGTIFYGDTSELEIYGEKDLSGVEKEGAGESFSKSYKQAEEERGYNVEGIQESINEAREDVSIVSQHLIDWYESQKQNEE